MLWSNSIRRINTRSLSLANIYDLVLPSWRTHAMGDRKEFHIPGLIYRLQCSFLQHIDRLTCGLMSQASWESSNEVSFSPWLKAELAHSNVSSASFRNISLFPPTAPPITFNEHRWSSIRLLWLLVSKSKKSSSLALVGIWALTCEVSGNELTRFPSGVSYERKIIF